MMLLLMLMGLIAPAHAIITSEIVVGNKEICPDVYRIDVLIDNAYLDTYYEFSEGTNWLECALHPEGLVDPLDDYPR